MSSKISLLFPGIILLFIIQTNAAVLKQSLTLCPDEDQANVFLGYASVDVLPQESTGLVRRIRLPQIGLYEQHLTCIFAQDTSQDTSGGEAEIIEGGLGHKYVEIRLNSKIGHGLDYLVLVYSYNSEFNSTVKMMK